MISKTLYIRATRVADGGEDYVAEARVRRKDQFPGRSARRMTHLGMLVDVCIRDFDIDSQTPLIYASAFAESCSLEEFIDSFPHASPAGFQTSIHPSAVEQSLILRKRPTSRFFPLTSSRNLAGIALENVFLMQASRVVLVAGEEKGGWLTPFGLASDRSFGFAMEWVSEAATACGKLEWIEWDKAPQAEAQELPELYQAIKDRRSLRFPSYALGAWMELSWT